MARREHVESLPSQGELMRATSYTPDIWASAVAMLVSEGLKFILNAATDTLPHNCNLAKWRGVLSQKSAGCVAVDRPSFTY